MKLAKFGLTMFMLCCAVVGYCDSFELYQGKQLPATATKAADSEPSETKQNATTDHDKEPVNKLDDALTAPLGLPRSCAWMHGSHCTVFGDRLYTIIGLFLKLKSFRITAAGKIGPTGGASSI